MEPGFDTVLVVDFGAQYAQLIARRVREAGVYSEIVPHSITARELAERAPGRRDLQRRAQERARAGRAGHRPRRLRRSACPSSGICYGAQLLAQQLGGEVAQTGRGEYGRTELETTGAASVLLERATSRSG